MTKLNKPFIKWTGGKQSEAEFLISKFPKTYNHYFEPFLGSGAILLNVPLTHKAHANDITINLISLYKCVKYKNPELRKYIDFFDFVFNEIESTIDFFGGGLRNLMFRYNKTVSTAERLAIIKNSTIIAALFCRTEKYVFESGLDVEFLGFDEKTLVRTFDKLLKRGEFFQNVLSKDLETGLKSAFYTHVRKLFNHDNVYRTFGANTAIFYFIREYAYAGMFRYNRKGDFNVPYGGRSYNKKRLGNKLNRFVTNAVQQRLAKTELWHGDAVTFLKNQFLLKKDFIFLDPPYDSTFSTYGGHVFNEYKQRELARWLYTCPAKFMLVINKSQLTEELYVNQGFAVEEYHKDYTINIKNRMDAKATHLLVTNYNLGLGRTWTI